MALQTFERSRCWWRSGGHERESEWGEDPSLPGMNLLRESGAEREKDL
jgi:hypothetical protein